MKYFIDKCPKLKILRRPVNKQWSIDIEHDRYWYKIAFLWGDEIENIIAELQRRQKQQVQLWGDEIENIIAELQRRQKQQVQPWDSRICFFFHLMHQWYFICILYYLTPHRSCLMNR